MEDTGRTDASTCTLMVTTPTHHTQKHTHTRACTDELASENHIYEVLTSSELMLAEGTL